MSPIRRGRILDWRGAGFPAPITVAPPPYRCRCRLRSSQVCVRLSPATRRNMPSVPRTGCAAAYSVPASRYGAAVEPVPVEPGAWPLADVARADSEVTAAFKVGGFLDGAGRARPRRSRTTPNSTHSVALSMAVMDSRVRSSRAPSLAMIRGASALAGLLRWKRLLDGHCCSPHLGDPGACHRSPYSSTMKNVMLRTS